MIAPDSQQVYEREDMHELALQGQKNNFNIRRFKERDLKDKRNSLYTKHTEPSSKNRINTEPIEDRMKTQFSETAAFQRIMAKKQPDHNKRNNFVGSLKNRKLLHTSTQKHSVTSTSNIQPHNEATDLQLQQQRTQECRNLAKAHNKGPMSKKIIQTWLNSIIMQTIQFEILDQSLSNAALKKFQIDENSLISRSIKPDNVVKIYQALFVHSIGFNNNLKELVGGKTDVLKNVWKVFSILLEYCAQGKFQTMIGMIQREKVIKLEQLRQQVSKRQQIIQRNDQLNQTKNIQIYKQIRTLKQQNQNLTNQKQILFEDYQKTEQAFNQEVALRLKFQNKINQLFGVHRELAIKHQRLYEDYKSKVLEWNLANQKNGVLGAANGELRVQLNDVIDERNRLLSSQRYNNSLINILQQDKQKLKQDYNILKHSYDQQRRITKQQKRSLKQLQIQLKNLTQICQIKDKSWKQTHSEYQMSLEENHRLYTAINQQRIQIQQLLYSQKEFNNRVINIVAEASFQKKKKEEYMGLYYKTDALYKGALENIKQLQLEIKIVHKKNQSVEKDLEANYVNIKAMHLKNGELEDQLHLLRRFRDDLDKVLEEKDALNTKISKQNQCLQLQNQQVKTNLSKAQISFTMTKAELTNEIQFLTKRYNQIKQQSSILQAGDDQKNQVIKSMKQQQQRITKLLQSTIFDLKNQKFQRFTLKTNYDQSLSIIEKKNVQEKDMGRQISELKELATRTGRERDKIRFDLDNQVQRRQRCQQTVTQLQEQIRQLKHQKSNFIHILIHEDVVENFRIVRQKLQRAVQALIIKQQQIFDLHEKYQMEIAAIQKSNQEYFDNFKKQKQKQIFQKQNELEYEKQVKASMKSRLQKLQSLSDTYTKKIEQRTNSQKQQVYTQLIQQKTKAIQQLIIKLGIESEKNQTISKEMLQKKQEHQKELLVLNKQITEEKQLREDKISQLNFQIGYIKKQSEQLLEEIKVYETQFQTKLKERMEVYLENYKKHESQAISNTQSETLQRISNKFPAISQAQDRSTVPAAFMNTETTNWRGLQRIQVKDPKIRKRNSISKKIKIAYSYYQS